MIFADTDRWIRPGVGNPWHACRTWNASTSLQHVSEASETRSSPFKVSVSSFSFVNNPLFNFTLMCFWCHMTKNRAVSTALHSPQLGGLRCHRGPNLRPLTRNFGWHAEEFCHWFSRFRHANQKRLPVPDLDVYNHQKVPFEASSSVLTYSFSAFPQEGSGISCVHYSSLDSRLKRCCIATWLRLRFPAMARRNRGRSLVCTRLYTSAFVNWMRHKASAP